MATERHQVQERRLSNGDLLLLAMSLGYLAAAAAYFLDGNKGYALALFAYSIANLGLIYAAK